MLNKAEIEIIKFNPLDIVDTSCFIFGDAGGTGSGDICLVDD